MSIFAKSSAFMSENGGFLIAAVVGETLFLSEIVESQFQS